MISSSEPTISQSDDEKNSVVSYQSAFILSNLYVVYVLTLVQKICSDLPRATLIAVSKLSPYFINHTLRYRYLFLLSRFTGNHDGSHIRFSQFIYYASGIWFQSVLQNNETCVIYKNMFQWLTYSGLTGLLYLER